MINISELYKERNHEIYNLFLSNYRQKEIANMYGLSESQVKHIIGAIRRAVKHTSQGEKK